jgi:hypothetical protein
MSRRIHYHHTPPPWLGIRRGRDNAVLVIGKRHPDCEFDLAIGTIHDASDANGDLMVLSPVLLDALREIARGEGAFSRDPLTHATNCIESMKAIAAAAIALAEVRTT